MGEAQDTPALHDKIAEPNFGSFLGVPEGEEIFELSLDRDLRASISASFSCAPGMVSMVSIRPLPEVTLSWVAFKYNNHFKFFRDPERLASPRK